ncbi:Nramp family divalent metal transporter [Marinoscillum furvescens]|uniref:Mn2+/Fe2+ NRAMP family transporter n=1 Tax=Marinoscillum furvescens DSM 4134 TaxID=1122208 RepID=A0A3D9L1J2_MARFU|nr:Nramp family divalent metal transporter [Marinoscillum furvescens]RED97915.1 Mn2+/Fe2+ NRAMP family transporter [Marinoscillum furvescens DSM 4134]
MKRILTRIGPGLLVAATGVGAGDLATSALAGSNIGLVAIWAVVIGGIMKFVLNEGLTKWQLDTNSTLIEGALLNTSKLVGWSFLVYLTVWSFTVAVALMSANGIAVHAIWPVFDDPGKAKVVFGIVLSLTGWLLVKVGGFTAFERIMSLSVALMVVAVCFTLFKLDFAFDDFSGFWQSSSTDLSWFIATMGGVGGTVTVLCYGYWIREHQREGREGLRQSRIDLALAYGTTVLLGVGMVIIGSRIEIQGGGASLLVQLAAELETHSGPLVAWIFRLGAFAAIFSSLLGVWQSVPYLYADVLQRLLPATTPAKTYNRSLALLALVPICGLPLGFAKMQKLYALSGALFVPMLAGILIYLGYRSNVFQPSKRTIFLYFAVFGVFTWLLVRWLIS